MIRVTDKEAVKNYVSRAATTLGGRKRRTSYGMGDYGDDLTIMTKLCRTEGAFKLSPYNADEYHGVYLGAADAKYHVGIFTDTLPASIKLVEIFNSEEEIKKIWQVT